jgi:ParB family chromosome partitioning protein
MPKQALDGTRINAFGMEPKDLVIVGFDTDDGPEHPLWDERVKQLRSSVDQPFIDSIKRLGVIEPVVVRKNGERVEVIAGRRRTYGARLANEQLLAANKKPLNVPCMYKRPSEGEAEEMRVAENEQRVGDSAIVKARNIQRYLDHGHSEADARIAFAESDLGRYLALLELDDRVQKAIDRGELAMTTALTLRDLTRDQQWEEAQKFIASGVTVVEAKRQKAARQSGNGHAEEGEVRGKRPGAAVIRQLTANEKFLSELSDDARHILFWFAGEESRAAKVKGLTAALRGE